MRLLAVIALLLYEVATIQLAPRCLQKCSDITLEDILEKENLLGDPKTEKRNTEYYCGLQSKSTTTSRPDTTTPWYTTQDDATTTYEDTTKTTQATTHLSTDLTTSTWKSTPEVTSTLEDGSTTTVPLTTEITLDKLTTSRLPFIGTTTEAFSTATTENIDRSTKSTSETPKEPSSLRSTEKSTVFSTPTSNEPHLSSTDGKTTVTLPHLSTVPTSEVYSMDPSTATSKKPSTMATDGISNTFPNAASTTSKPPLTTLNAPSTLANLVTSTLEVTTTAPSTTTIVTDPTTSTINTETTKGQTLKPTTVIIGTIEATTPTQKTGTTLTTSTKSPTTFTRPTIVFTATTVSTKTPSPPNSKAPVTKIETSTAKSTVSTQLTSTQVTVTSRTPAISAVSTTIFNSTMESSTTDMSSKTSTGHDTSNAKTTVETIQISSAPERSTRTTINTSRAARYSTISTKETTPAIVEVLNPSLTQTTVTTTVTNSQKSTTESKVPTSTNSEIPTTEIPTTQDEMHTSKTSIFPTEPLNKIYSRSYTYQNREISTTASYPTASSVTSMETSPGLEGTTVTKRSVDMTTTAPEIDGTTIETKTNGATYKTDRTTENVFEATSPSTEQASQGTSTPSVASSTPLLSTTEFSSEATTGRPNHVTNVTDLTAETLSDATSLSTESVTQEMASTEIDVSTESPSTRPPWCDYPCPYGYTEAERGCFIMVPEEFRQNFMSAFMWCRSEDRRDLSDQDDIMTSNMIETLKYMLRLNGIRSDIIYLNGHADKLMRKDKKAGLIHLEGISIWDNLPTDYVGISTDTVNVTGICRMPKFCETPVCDLNAIYKMLPEKVEEVNNKTIVMGSGISLKCLYPSRDLLNVRCIEPGELMPSPTLLACTIPADVKYEKPEKEVTGNMRIRPTCADCYDDGTANCTAEEYGFVCNCKENWSKFTCYKSVDLCPPQYCGPNGNCVTQLEDFFCNFTSGWIGDKCDVNIKKITWGGNKTIRIISSNTIASGLLGISSGIQISLKVLSKVITDKDPEDPQEAYQAFRSTCLTMGNLAIALFQHPDLLSSEPISCRWFFFFVHICYSLAFVFMLDEVLNVCTTIHGLHRNNWVHDNKMKKRWWLDIPARIQFPFVLVFALLWYVASQGWSKIPATWTCFGVFKRETSNIWYPLVLFNFVSIVLCFGFAENARKTLSHRIQFWTANMHLVDVTNPYIRESIEKVRRNVPYCFLLPPFMFLNWLFLCWAADQQTDTVKFLSLLFSGCYTVLSMLQTLETSTGIYEYVVYYGHLYLPNCISNRILQDLTPMTWLCKDEIVAKKWKIVFKGLDASSPYHPASICYITLEHEHLMLRRMTREYLDHRVTHYSKQDEATLSVYFNELRLRHVYERNVPLEDLHLELILETWITDTKRIDQLTIPKKAKKQRETWRTRIREKNRIPPKENTNIRRMRFLKSIMDYHLKTLNPTLEYPVTGAMQRTDFRTFSPACPCVLRSQVEDLQRTWLPIIDIYIEQDWSLREVYKEVQQAEGYKPREPRYECKKEDVEEDHWLNELRPGFIGPRSYPLVYLPALGTYLELDYYQRFADLEWARLVKHSEYLGACYDFGR